MSTKFGKVEMIIAAVSSIALLVPAKLHLAAVTKTACCFHCQVKQLYAAGVSRSSSLSRAA